MPRSAMRALTAMLALAAGSGCARAAPCNGVSCAPVCPRDSTIGAAGRCVCAEGTVSLLGACVPSPVVEAFCGPAARVESDGATAGCVFRTCAAGLSLDVASGACIPRGMLPRRAFECRAPAVALVEDGRAACVSPEAACPRGTRPSGDAARARCERTPACPPGSLAEGSACRPVVTTGGRSGSRVDVGTWAALALGIHGGPGSSALCQPLSARPGLFAASIGPSAGTSDAGGPLAGGGITVQVAISIALPDQDVSRLHAEVHTRSAAGGPVSPAAEALASGSVATLLEALRSLGGEASAASVELEVSCAVGEESM